MLSCVSQSQGLKVFDMTTTLDGRFRIPVSPGNNNILLVPKEQRSQNTAFNNAASCIFSLKRDHILLFHLIR